MLRIKLLRNLLFLSLAITIFLPGHEFFVIHPDYRNLLTSETESEAVRYASYMVRTLGLENQYLTRDILPEGLEDSFRPVSRDKRLMKLRVFSADGEIIFSTKAEEVGNINQNDYFHEVVARGEVYSKVVQKDHTTAEGVPTQVDIVETYVPFMVEGAFGGAIEVYYDVTETVKKVAFLSVHSMITTLVLTIVFLLAIFVALRRAHLSLQERAAAEEALRLSNEELEKRVDERTRELSAANEQLVEQVAEKVDAQKALGQALEEIKLDREKLDWILRSVPDGVVVADGSLNVLHMNAAAESILGTSLEEMLGQSVGLLSQKVDFVEKIGALNRLAYGSRSFDVELPREDSRQDGIYQVRLSRLITDDSEDPGVVLLIHDVTREREVERMKSAFLSMAAHELNTPLTSIIGYTELLTAEETSALFNTKQKEACLKLIHDKALALGGLVSDLLDISSVESGRPLALDYQEFNIDVILREIVASKRKKHDRHQFELFLPDGKIPLHADPSRVEQVVEHLLSNAVKYSPDGGVVRLELTLHDGHCALVVEDKGIGMTEEQLAHIFDRFYRADTSDTAVQGVGLGLSLVRNIVLAHQGDIQVESKSGQGTRICVTLPLRAPEGEPETVSSFSS